LTSWTTKEVSEDIILDGTTDVPTVNSYVIIHRMKVLTNGATNINVGDIAATAVTDATVTAQIKIGFGQTQMAIYGVPSIQDVYITSFYAIGRKGGGTSKLIDIDLKINEHPDVELLGFVGKESGAVTGATGQGLKISFEPFKKISGPAIIKLQANSDTANSEVSAGFNVILVDNQ